MQDFWLRVFLAATLSISGALFTFGWSRSNQIKAPVPGPKPLARLISSANEVQRRPENRLIWQSVFRDEELYAGEAIRTAGNAEAVIQFLQEGSTVQLDPDSVIEIEERDGGINLDFLKGNLIVRSVSEKSGLTLRSGDETIVVGKSELQVTKTSVGGPLDIEVFKGNAQISEKGQSQSVRPRPKLKLLSPHPNEVFFTLPDVAGTVPLLWQPIDPSYQVYLETGEERSSLKAVALNPVAGSTGSMQFPFKIGKTYFRLSARSRRPELPVLQSSISRVEMKAKIPPVPLEPVRNGSVQPKGGRGEVTFRWSNPGQLEDLVLEVAGTADLKDPFQVRNVQDLLTQTVSVPKDVPQIFWRVSGRLPGTRLMVASKIHHFRVLKEGLQPLIAPVLKSPAPSHSIPWVSMNSHGVRLSWEPVQGANRYEVSLAETDPSASSPTAPTVFKQEARSTELSVRNLKTASYSWSVIAKDDSGQESPASETRRFSIEGVPPLAWSDGLISARTVTRSTRPLLRVSWAAGPGAPKSWRIRIRSDREPASDPGWRVVSRPEFETTLSDLGIYRIEAESLDGNGVVIARAEIRTHEFIQAPPLPAPEFGDALSEVIQANDQGAAEIAWKPVPEAREYILKIKTPDGQEVQSSRTTDTAETLTRMKTGEYTVTLQTVDASGRVGNESLPRRLSVPEYSDVEAPTLRNVNVK